MSPSAAACARSGAASAGRADRRGQGGELPALEELRPGRGLLRRDAEAGSEKKYRRAVVEKGKDERATGRFHQAYVRRQYDARITPSPARSGQ